MYAVAVSFSKSTLFVHSNIYIALILSVIMRYNVNLPDFPFGVVRAGVAAEGVGYFVGVDIAPLTDPVTLLHVTMTMLPPAIKWALTLDGATGASLPVNIHFPAPMPFPAVDEHST